MLKPLLRKTFRLRRIYVRQKIARILGALLAAGLSPLQLRAENWEIVPEVSLSETYTDNLALAPSETAQSGWITTITPGIRIKGEGARVQASLDYRLHQIIYHNQDQNQARDSNTRNILNSLISIEAVDNWLYVDANARILQQNRSAFDAAPSLTNASRNLSETTVYQISPHIHGNISDLATYQLRFTSTDGSSADNTLSYTKTNNWIGAIQSASPLSLISWSIKGNSLTAHNAALDKKVDNWIQASLIFAIHPQFHASIINGYETTDFADTSRQSNSTPGVGFEWSPSERTQISAHKERRVIGQEHSLIFSHRTPHTAWQYSDIKDMVVLPLELAASTQSTIRNLFSELLAAGIKDPVARAKLAASQPDEPSAIPALPNATDGFLTSQVYVNRKREASAVLLGANNTVTFTLRQNDYQGVGMNIDPTDPLFGRASNIRQRRLYMAWRHRLSPLSSITVSASNLRSKGLGASDLESTQRWQSLIFSTQIGPKAFVSVGARHVHFDSTVSSNYRENAVLASLSLRF